MKTNKKHASKKKMMNMEIDKIYIKSKQHKHNNEHNNEKEEREGDPQHKCYP